MKLTFCGATETVTGSCTHIATKEQTFLVDCGLFQGERVCGSRNLLPFPFDPKELKAVFVTHAHADHVGRLPKLVREGFTGPIYCTRPTMRLMRLVLLDALHLMEEAAAMCNDPILYDASDIENVMTQCQSIAYHQAISLGGECEVMLHDAGHILGSAYVSIEAEGKRLIVSGDLGNEDVPILPPTEPILRADIVVCESTYGDRTHEPMTERVTKLQEAIEHILKEKGVLLIPAFSLERTQEVLYAMNEIFHTLQARVPIFLDSPMAIKATQIYREEQGFLKFDRPIESEGDRDFFSFPNLRETLTTDESKLIRNVPAPKVIIAGSGMMSGGRILHHLKQYLPLSSTRLLIIGYQADGTLGQAIVGGAKTVKIHNEEIPVHAKLAKIGAFSAHADQQKLFTWLYPESGIAPKKVILVHGEEGAKQTLATRIRGELGSDAVIPKMGEVVEV